MINSKHCLAISIGANVVLLAVVLAMSHQPARPVVPAPPTPPPVAAKRTDTGNKNIQPGSHAGPSDNKARVSPVENKYAPLQNTDDSSGGDLRLDLAGVQVSADQYSALNQAQQEWKDAADKLDQQLQEGALSTADYDHQMGALETAREQQFEKILGADAYAAYLKKAGRLVSDPGT